MDWSRKMVSPPWTHPPWQSFQKLRFWATMCASRCKLWEWIRMNNVPWFPFHIYSLCKWSDSFEKPWGLIYFMPMIDWISLCGDPNPHGVKLKLQNHQSTSSLCTARCLVMFVLFATGIAPGDYFMINQPSEKEDPPQEKCWFSRDVAFMKLLLPANWYIWHGAALTVHVCSVPKIPSLGLEN